MSISRQQRRAMQRKLAINGITNETAESVIVALREQSIAKQQAADSMVPKVTDEVYARIKREWEPQIYARAMGDALTMILAFEHIDRHHTGKWLRQWLRDFNEFGDDLNASGETMEALKKILLDECGFDIVKEFAECEELSNVRNAEKGRLLA